MKRAKIMLSALGVLTVVGGALAFKAKTFQERNVFCLIPNSSPTCQLAPYKTDIDDLGSTTAPCPNSPITTVYFTNANCNDPKTGTVYVTANQ